MKVLLTHAQIQERVREMGEQIHQPGSTLKGSPRPSVNRPTASQRSGPPDTQKVPSSAP